MPADPLAARCADPACDQPAGTSLKYCPVHRDSAASRKRAERARQQDDARTHVLAGASDPFTAPASLQVSTAALRDLLDGQQEELDVIKAALDALGDATLVERRMLAAQADHEATLARALAAERRAEAAEAQRRSAAQLATDAQQQTSTTAAELAVLQQQVADREQTQQGGLAELQEAHTNALHALGAAHEHAVASREEEHVRQLEALRQEHHTDISRLQARAKAAEEAASAHVHRLEKDLLASAAQLADLTAERDGLWARLIEAHESADSRVRGIERDAARRIRRAEQRVDRLERHETQG